jgi:hypothetical protein
MTADPTPSRRMISLPVSRRDRGLPISRPGVARAGPSQCVPACESAAERACPDSHAGHGPTVGLQVPRSECRGLMVKASGWRSFDRQFEPYFRARKAALTLIRVSVTLFRYAVR